MSRKPKPLHNHFELSIIESAVSWTAFVQLAPRHRVRFEAATRQEAVAEGERMAAAFNRGILIYAIHANGNSALAQTIPAPSRMPAPGLGA